MALNKSKDRLLYLIGMAATFIGLLIPYVRTDEGSMLNVISGTIFQHPFAAKTA